nr:2'-5' RNA ligase family protein [Modestobacter marinus]
MPAHVTVLFPFVPPGQLDDVVLQRVARVTDGTRAFDHRFSRTAGFGDDVVYLAPDDPQPFRDLTSRVHAAFPAHPPFEGVYDHVVPHLTIGLGHARAELEAAEREVLPTCRSPAEQQPWCCSASPPRAGTGRHGRRSRSAADRLSYR